MTIAIGRASGLNATQIKHSGDRVSISGTIVGADAYAARAQVQQVLGLSNNDDEPVVPVVYGNDDLDGFYTVVSSGVEQLGPITGKSRRYSVELERVVGYANPWFEVIAQSVVRTNGYNASPAGIIAAFLSTYELDVAATFSLADQTTTEDWPAANSPGITLDTYTATAPVAPISYRYSGPAFSHLIGRCRVEVQQNGAWYEVVGRQVPANSIWRISNGIVRLTSAIGATPGKIEFYDAAAVAWEGININHVSGTSPGTGYRSLGGIGFGDQTIKPTLTILRNSPEEVIVRTWQAGGSYGTTPGITYRLQRGARQFICNATSANYFVDIGINHSTTTAMTGGGAGYAVDTTANGNGNKLVIGTNMPPHVSGIGYTAGYSSTTEGGIFFVGGDSNDSSTLWCGMDTINSGSGSTTVATRLRDRFLAATSWRQRVVPR